MKPRPFKDTPKKELKELIACDEHNEYEDDETGEWIHAYWDCRCCDAEGELKIRAYLKDSKKPGRLPHSEGGSVHHNIKARELKVGSFSRYLSKPGTSDYPFEYAEAIEVELKGKKVLVRWRKSNTKEEPFSVSYKASESLNVVEKFPAKAE